MTKRKIKNFVLFPHLALISAVFLCFNGCYSYKPPPKCVADDNLTGPEKKEKIIPAACKVLTLELAEEIALANNPDYKSKHHAMTAAWQRYYQSLSSYLPTVTATYDFNHDINNPTVQKNLKTGQGANRSKAYGNSLGLQGQWLIFDGLVRTMNALVKKHQAREYEKMEEDSRRLLLLAVANQYNSVLLAIEKNRIAKTDMDFQEKMLNETQLKYDAGAVPLSDVLNFKIKSNEAEGSLIDSQYEYNTAIYALAALMGITEAKLPDNLKFPPMSSGEKSHLADVSVYIDTALTNRPDLEQYREALEATKYTMYSKWGAFSPTVTLNGELGWSRAKTAYDGRYGNRLEGSSNWDTINQGTSAGYGIAVEWTLFDGTKRFTAIREAQALLAEAEYELTYKWITVVEEVRAAYENYIKSEKLALLYRRTLGLVTKQRDLVEEEYKAGNTELTRLNEAQRNLVEADTNLVSSLINVQNAKAQLEAVINSR
jgi:outer membrane protein TolC